MMTLPFRLPLHAAAFASTLCAALAADVAAQPAAATCSTLLSAETLAKAVSPGFKDMGARPRGAGETECPWMLRGDAGFKTVTVQFYDLSAIKASPNASTSDAFFEQVVVAAEGMASGKKRQALPGIGNKAVFVPTDPQVLAVVQRADGVARIVGNNLSKAQITAVAQAVGKP